VTWWSRTSRRQRVIEDHGGVVEKFIGDAVMAVFWAVPVEGGRRASCGPGRALRAKFTAGFVAAFGSEEDAGRHARLVRAWLGFGPDDTTSLPSDPQTLPAEAARSLAEYFARLSAVAPVVILLEDLHRADDGSLYWLDAADPVLKDARVLVVATSRPSLLEERPTCWQVTEAAQDRAVSSVLLAACTYLRARTAAIGDERLAQGYLTAPVNAGLLPAGEEAG
jgi:hypothetical protein